MNKTEEIAISFFCPTGYKWLLKLKEGLTQAGYNVQHNKIDKNTDIILTISDYTIRTPYEYKTAWENNIPIVEFMMDIPIWRLSGSSYHPTNKFYTYKVTIKEKIKFRLLHIYYWYIYAVALKNRLEKCALVLSLSKKTKEDLLNVIGIDSKVCYLYIDKEKFDSIEIADKKNQIIQISRFIPHKKFDQTIKAVSLLNELSNTQYKLVYIGNGGDSVHIQKLSDENNVDVEIHVNADDELLVRKLKESKLLVSPSSFEGLGLSPIEALYCKVPVLLSDITTFREIYGDKVIYHELNNYEDQAMKMKYILENENVSSGMIRDAKEIIQFFSFEKAIERLSNHIISVVSSVKILN